RVAARREAAEPESDVAVARRADAAQVDAPVLHRGGVRIQDADRERVAVTALVEADEDPDGVAGDRRPVGVAAVDAVRLLGAGLNVRGEAIREDDRLLGGG